MRSRGYTIASTATHYHGNSNKRVIRTDLGSLRISNPPPWLTTYDYVLKNTYSVLRVCWSFSLSWAQEMRASPKTRVQLLQYLNGYTYT
jgi:hypothetical protein